MLLPTKATAQLEGSKAFSKDFMARHKIPTAEYRNFNNYEEAKDYVESVPHRLCLKPQVLQLGKE